MSKSKSDPRVVPFLNVVSLMVWEYFLLLGAFRYSPFMLGISDRRCKAMAFVFFSVHWCILSVL